MQYRKLTSDGDYQFGATNQFHVDTPEGVAQAIKTRLGLWTGEWFLDTTEGTPYETQILGFQPQSSRDLAVKQRIVETQGVLELLEYSSSLGQDRVFTVAARVSTLYGEVSINL